MTLAAAERLLRSKVVARTAFQIFPIETLTKLCEEHGMVVQATSRKPKGSKKKSDYIAAIIRYVSHRSAMVYNKWSHQIVQRQEAEATATRTRTSSPMLVDTQSQDDEMMDIQPQDDEVTSPGDCRIPVAFGR